MYAFLIVVHIIVSVILILVILLQAGRGGGLSETFGISSTQTFFGTSAAKFLQNTTSVCAVIFLLTCLSLAALSTHKSRSLMGTGRAKQAVQQVVTQKIEHSVKMSVTQEAPKAESPHLLNIPNKDKKEAME